MQRGLRRVAQRSAGRFSIRKLPRALDTISGGRRRAHAQHSQSLRVGGVGLGALGRRSRALGAPGSSGRRRRLPRSAPRGRRLTGHHARGRRQRCIRYPALPIPRRTVCAVTCSAPSGATGATGAAARSRASGGRTPKPLPRSGRAILQGRCSARCAGVVMPSAAPLGADSICAIVRRRAAAAGRIGGHFAPGRQCARARGPTGPASPISSRRGGWKSPTTPGVWDIRLRGPPPPWGRDDASQAVSIAAPGSEHRGGYTPVIPAAAGSSGRPATRKPGRKVTAGLPGPYGHRQPCGFQREKEAATSGQRLSCLVYEALLDRHRDIKSNRLSQHGSISGVGIRFAVWLGRRNRYHGRPRTKPHYHKVLASIK